MLFHIPLINSINHFFNNLLMLLQIKIWFQNRRTKWKRKYTNDLELVAQQYYSALGVAAPRPLFLGDRLWYEPMQPLLL